jgi:hypothetical protein
MVFVAMSRFVRKCILEPGWFLLIDHFQKASLMYLPFIDSCYTIPDKLIGYVYFPPVSASPDRALSFISSPQILAESAILGLQVFHHIQRSRADDAFQTPLITTLYRDGYLYFAAVMSLRVLSIFIVSPPTVRISSLTISSTPLRPRPSGFCQIKPISQFQRKRILLFMTHSPHR